MTTTNTTTNTTVQWHRSDCGRGAPEIVRVGDIYMGEAITSRTRCRGRNMWALWGDGQSLTVAEAYYLWRCATASNEWIRQARRAALYGEEIVLTDRTHSIEGLTLYLTATANNDLFRVAWSWCAVTAATIDSVDTMRRMMAREAVTA